MRAIVSMMMTIHFFSIRPITRWPPRCQQLPTPPLGHQSCVAFPPSVELIELILTGLDYSNDPTLATIWWTCSNIEPTNWNTNHQIVDFLDRISIAAFGSVRKKRLPLIAMSHIRMSLPAH